MHFLTELCKFWHIFLQNFKVQFTQSISATMSSQEFHVVEFVDEQSTAVVPHLWLTDSESCVWPPYKTSARINCAVQREEVPGEGWSAQSVRILFSGML